MEIKKGGFVCQVAYVNVDEDEIPSQVNGCQLFTRFVFFGLITIAIYVCLAIAFVVGLPFAARPSIFDGDNANVSMNHYRHWPTIKGRRIYPFWVMLAIGVLYNLAATQAVVVGVLHATIFSTTFWLICGAFVALIVAVMIYITLEESETVDLVREFIKAKKRKVCPIIKIVE